MILHSQIEFINYWYTSVLVIDQIECVFIQHIEKKWLHYLFYIISI